MLKQADGKKRKAPHMMTGLAISANRMYTAYNCSPKSIHSLNSKFKVYGMLFEDWCRCSVSITIRTHFPSGITENATEPLIS